MKWTIQPHVGCGALSFGMKADGVRFILGPSENVRQSEGACVEESRRHAPWNECTYSQNGLVSIASYLEGLENLSLDDNEMLGQPILELVDFLGQRNGGLFQAQGGSLYFDRLGMALLQFEDRNSRTLVLFSSGFDHREPLRQVSMSEVAEYYEDIMERDPAADLFGA